jgi:hypothetical protein
VGLGREARSLWGLADGSRPMGPRGEAGRPGGDWPMGHGREAGSPWGLAQGAPPRDRSLGGLADEVRLRGRSPWGLAHGGRPRGPVAGGLADGPGGATAVKPGRGGPVVVLGPAGQRR